MKHNRRQVIRQQCIESSYIPALSHIHGEWLRLMSFGAIVTVSLMASDANGLRRFLSEGVAFSVGQFGKAYARHVRPLSCQTRERTHVRASVARLGPSWVTC